VISSLISQPVPRRRSGPRARRAARRDALERGKKLRWSRCAGDRGLDDELEVGDRDLFSVLGLFGVPGAALRACEPTNEEADVELVPGQAPSAPVNFDPKKIAIRVTIVATLLFAIFYLNYVNGWVTTEMLDWWAHINPPAGS
jgi:predicted secreted protein